jgi:hypothetical protein
MREPLDAVSGMAARGGRSWGAWVPNLDTGFDVDDTESIEGSLALSDVRAATRVASSRLNDRYIALTWGT